MIREEIKARTNECILRTMVVIVGRDARDLPHHWFLFSFFKKGKGFPYLIPILWPRLIQVYRRSACRGL